MILLGAVTMSVGGLIFVVNLFGIWVPRSLPAAAAFSTLVVASWVRAAFRWMREHDDMRTLRGSAGATPVIVIGAGEAGREIIGSMLRNPQSRCPPVAMLADDPAKKHRRTPHVPAAGDLAAPDRSRAHQSEPET